MCSCVSFSAFDTPQPSTPKKGEKEKNSKGDEFEERDKMTQAFKLTDCIFGMLEGVLCIVHAYSDDVRKSMGC